MRFTRRLKKEKGQEAAPQDDNKIVKRGSTQRRGLSTSNTAGRTSRTSRSDSLKSQSKQPVLVPSPPASSSSLPLAALAGVDRDDDDMMVGEHSPHQLFQDDDDDDENDSDQARQQQQQPLVPPTLNAPATPNSHQRQEQQRTNRETRQNEQKAQASSSSTNKPFCPPKEINIDFQAVPPSPMRDPSVALAHFRDSDDPGLILDLGNAARVQPSNSLSTASQPPKLLFGDPVGDIAMKRHLLDAQRLVRLVLGKPMNVTVDPHEINAPLLETNTILQAIRAFALMKQEVVELRKRQEVADGDPPAILQSLGSPTTTTASRTASPSSPTAHLTPTTAAAAVNAVTGYLPPPSNSIFALWEARQRIKALEEELKTAQDTVRTLQEQQQQLVLPPSKEEGEEAEDEHQILKHKYQRLLECHEAAVEESRFNLDLVLEEVASVPKRVLAKDSVREKLRTYVQTISNHASLADRLEQEDAKFEATVQQERQSSKQRTHEIEIPDMELVQEISNDKRDDEILHLHSLLRQSQEETDRLIGRLERLRSRASTMSPEDAKENQILNELFDPKKIASRSKVASLSPSTSCEEEKKADD